MEAKSLLVLASAMLVCITVLEARSMPFAIPQDYGFPTCNYPPCYRTPPPPPPTDFDIRCHGTYTKVTIDCGPDPPPGSLCGDICG